jgi:hypothetical protein
MDRLSAAENLLRFATALDSELSETRLETAETIAEDARRVLGVTEDELKEASRRVWASPSS